MKYVRAALARIRGMFLGHRGDDDLREELQSHLEMQTAENLRRGMSPEEARRQARMASGGLTQAAEAVRDQRGLPGLEGLAADLRYAIRALRRGPGYTTVVVATLGLGIGANTAIFSVVRGVLLKPLPHQDGDRLVYLRQSAYGPGQTNLNFSVPEVRDLRTGVPALGGVAEYSGWGVIRQTSEGSQRLPVGLVTGNFFEVMGLSPVLGRVTGPGDDGPAAAPVAVLAYQYWRERFGGDSSIVGQVISLDKKPVTVIGVLQPAPFFPDRVDALLNMVNSEHHLSASMLEFRTHRMTEVVARLAPGATVEQARAQVAAVYTRLQREFTDAYDPASHYRVAVIPFKQAMGERAQLTLWLLMGAAAFVLIIAAANVANLTLMRGVRREQELVARAALGAGVARLRRLLLAENLLLALMGGTLGVVIAVGGLRLLVSLAERYSNRAGEIQLDVVVLGFTLMVCVAVALLRRQMVDATVADADLPCIDALQPGQRAIAEPQFDRPSVDLGHRRPRQLRHLRHHRDRQPRAQGGHPLEEPSRHAKPRHRERQPFDPRSAAARHPHRFYFQVGREVADRAVPEPDRVRLLEPPLGVLPSALRTPVRSALAGHGEHLDPPHPPRPLDLHQLDLEVLQPEIDREIIPLLVLVHPSDPPLSYQEERPWMNQDVSPRQAAPITPPPLRSPKSERSLKERA